MDVKHLHTEKGYLKKKRLLEDNILEEEAEKTAGNLKTGKFIFRLVCY